MEKMMPMSSAPTDGTMIELWHEGCRYGPDGVLTGEDGEPIEVAGWVRGAAFATAGHWGHYWHCPEVDDGLTSVFDGWRPITD
jgi:hypothetical protein